MKRRNLAFLSAFALSLGGCSADGGSIGPEASDSVSQALNDQASVFGFESVSYWSVSSGTKSSTSDVSQGTAALALSNFTYSAITSVPLASLTGVTSTLKLDVKPPAALAWGQVQVFVSVPSANVYEANSNAVSVVGLSPSAYSSLTFTLPAAAVTALQSNATDKTIKIAINSPQSASNFKLDNLRFQGAVTNSVVEMRLSDVDDYVILTVDGVRRKVSYIGDPTVGVKQDVSAWFGGGNNTLRIQNINTGGPTNYRLELWVDGVLKVNDVAPAGVETQGIAVDRTISVNTPNRPAFQSVSVSSSGSGKLYIDDVYTGSATPVTLSLPQGSYKFGLGVSTDAPPSYTGSYYEKSVTVAGASQSVNMTSSAALGVQKTNSVVLVPVRDTWNYTPAAGTADPANKGVTLASDVSLVQGQLNAIRDQWYKPFSYGLAAWQTTILPMVTNTPLLETTAGDFKVDEFIDAAGLASLRQQYDRIIIFFSQNKADGTKVADHLQVAYARGRQQVVFTTEYSRLRGAGQPNPWLFHECLHNQENFNDSLLHQWNGINSLHGGDAHGYHDEGTSGATDFVNYYRMWMRGQVAELDAMRPDISWPSVPASGDLYVGIFPTLRVYTGKL